MVLGKSSWQKWLAHGLLALALVLSHSLPAMSMQQPAHIQHALMGDGHCHDEPSGHEPAAKLMTTVCQACPGMAVFLLEPMRLPVRVAVSSFDPPEPRLAQGISLSLDTPPPRPAFVV